MKLTLQTIKENPELLTYDFPIQDSEDLVLRPLNSDDVTLLTDFYKDLSPTTREFYLTEKGDEELAQEHIEAIAKYDKLRFVLVEKESNRCIGLIEFSFDIPDGDALRFEEYGIMLDSMNDCRFGPCLADEYQGRGLMAALFPYIIEIVQKFNQDRVILWGGVIKKNERGIKFYEKMGFRFLGEFKDEEERECIDMIIKL